MTEVHGHFGEFIQGLMPDGGLGLISVPCPAYEVNVDNAYHKTASSDLTEILRDFEISAEKNLQVQTNMIIGGGAGYSTALRMAIASHMLSEQSADQMLAVIQQSERAIDPLMFENFERLLWDSRAHRILEVLPELPKMKICGGFFGDVEYTSHEDMNFPLIDDLIVKWNSATTAKEFAELSTISATRTLNHRNNECAQIFELCEKHSALGVVIAHTGSLRGLIFSVDRDVELVTHEMCEQGFQNVVSFEIGGDK